MARVNVDLLLADYNELESRKNRSVNLSIEAAQAFAISRGYTAEQTVQLIEFVQTIEKNLDAGDQTKLDILSNYILNDEIVEEDEAVAVDGEVINQD